MKYIALDFETGGLDPNRHGACSLGVAVFEDGEVIDSREWLIKPPTHAKSGKYLCEYDICAFEINGLSWVKMKKEGISEPEVLRELMQFLDLLGCRDALIVSHNTAFDAAMLSQMVFRCGTWNYGKFEAFPEPLHGAWACTRRMCDRLGLENNNLDTVCAHFGMARTGEYHGALEDAILCGKVYGLLTEKAVAGAA